MLRRVHTNTPLQLKFALAMGFIFGFLLQKGGVTRYDVILGQLLLKDWTVVKIMLTAIIIGTLGIHWLKSLGYAQLHPKPGSVGATVIGGLMFGVGFALLGYCPANIGGAIGQGALDALIGGIPGILLGTGVYVVFYPKLKTGVLRKGPFPALTFPEFFKVDHWIVVIPVVMLLTLVLWLVETAG